MQRRESLGEAISVPVGFLGIPTEPRFLLLLPLSVSAAAAVVCGAIRRGIYLDWSRRAAARFTLGAINTSRLPFTRWGRC